MKKSIILPCLLAILIFAGILAGVDYTYKEGKVDRSPDGCKEFTGRMDQG